MIVIDASALVIGVADTTDRGAVVRSKLADAAIAPHLVDAEFGQGLRGLVLRGLLDDSAASRSMIDAQHLVVDRFPHSPLSSRAWELRENVSFYDGLYVALAEMLDMPLVTADSKLSNAHGPRCDIQLV